MISTSNHLTSINAADTIPSTPTTLRCRPLTSFTGLNRGWRMDPIPTGHEGYRTDIYRNRPGQHRQPSGREAGRLVVFQR